MAYGSAAGREGRKENPKAMEIDMPPRNGELVSGMVVAPWRAYQSSVTDG